MSMRQASGRFREARPRRSSVHRDGATHREQLRFPLTAPEADDDNLPAEPLDIEHLTVLTPNARPHAEHVAPVQRVLAEVQGDAGLRVLRCGFLEPNASATSLAASAEQRERRIP